MKHTLTRAASVVLALVLAVSLLAGCGASSGSSEALYTPGSYTGTAQGYGGTVTVTVTVDESSITAVTAEGADETPTVGGAALETLAQSIQTAGSAEIDAVAGATITSNAVMSAASDALAQARGESVAAAAAMKAGTYTASAWGFSKVEQLEVSVTVTEDAITDIQVNMDNGETAPILQSAIDLMIPRMLENQSVAVDAICGATASSNAIKQATSDCLVQALEAAGSSADGLKAFQTAEPTSDETVTLDTDVLVIGLGGSGLSAAVSAAQNLYEANGQDASKVNVLGIDKAGKIGGTSAVTSSPMAVNPPSMVEANGGDYTDAAALREDWLTYTKGDAKTELVDLMINESGEALDWLMDMGFEFGEPQLGFGTPYAVVCYYGDSMGANKDVVDGYFQKLLEVYESLGGEYMLETEGTELITDENGTVVGAKAVGQDGTQYTINAKVVVLAGGGFAGNPEMEEEYLSDEYYPLKGSWNLYGMAQNDGKTIQMALDIGAGTYNIGMPPMVHIGGINKLMHEFPVNQIEGQTDIWTGRTATWSLNDVPMVMALSPDTIAVGKDGKRFTDESDLPMFSSWKAGPEFYSLWSQSRIDEIAEKGFAYVNTGLFINQGGVPANTPIENIQEVVDAAIEAGIIVKADTLAELAEKLDIDPATLEASVASYNAYCETGEPNGEIEKATTVVDLYGNDLGEADYLKGIGEEGPFYAVIGAPWCYSTCGGLDINEDFQVLLADGETPIQGLYAVGTDSMGVLFTEQEEYVKYGGAAQGWAFTSGKLAGEVIAETLTA